MVKAAAAVRLANSELMKECMELCNRLDKKTVDYKGLACP
jgi:hypothetical protein